MNIRSLLTFVPYLAVVAVAALLGFSITRVDASAAEHKIGFTFGGALISAVAILITRAFSAQDSHPFPKIPARKLAGLKVGVVGFCIALFGWLVGVLANHDAGTVVVAVGVLVGFAGMAIHFVLMFKPNE